MLLKNAKRKSGRPSLTPGMESLRVQVSVDEETHHRWKRYAKKRGISMSAVMREAVEAMNNG